MSITNKLFAIILLGSIACLNVYSNTYTGKLVTYTGSPGNAMIQSPNRSLTTAYSDGVGTISTSGGKTGTFQYDDGTDAGTITGSSANQLATISGTDGSYTISGTQGGSIDTTKGSSVYIYGPNRSTTNAYISLTPPTSSPYGSLVDLQGPNGGYIQYYPTTSSEASVLLYGPNQGSIQGDSGAVTIKGPNNSDGTSLTLQNSSYPSGSNAYLAGAQGGYIQYFPNTPSLSSLMLYGPNGREAIGGNNELSIYSPNYSTGDPYLSLQSDSIYGNSLYIQGPQGGNLQYYPSDTYYSYFDLYGPNQGKVTGSGATSSWSTTLPNQDTITYAPDAPSSTAATDPYTITTPTGSDEYTRTGSGGWSGISGDSLYISNGALYYYDSNTNTTTQVQYDSTTGSLAPVTS